MDINLVVNVDLWNMRLIVEVWSESNYSSHIIFMLFHLYIYIPSY